MANVIEVVLKGTDKLSPVIKKSSTSFGGLTKSLNNMVAGAVSITAVTAAVIDCVKAAEEAQIVMAATEAVIESTGGAAGLTAKQVNNLAQAESWLTGIDDEVVQSGQNMLLTFRNIGGEVFPRATRAMEDMAVAMAGGNISALDLKGTAIQLGKALNDPLQGMSALQRVGVTFSASQKELIKGFMEVNDVASAQEVILKELEAEFGGMAEKMGTTDVGKIEKAKNAIENLKESIGTKLLPVLGDAATTFELLLTWNDKLNVAMSEHEGQVRTTAGSYEEYIAEMKRAAEVAGFQIDAEGNLVEVYKGKDHVSRRLIEANFALTESEFELLNVTDELDKTTEDYNKNLELQAFFAESAAKRLEYLNKVEADLRIQSAGLAAGLGGEYAEANERYEQSLANLQDEHDQLLSDLREAKNEYGANSEQVKELTSRLQDNEQQQKDLAAATKETVAQMIYQQAAAGLSAGAALELARSMGLISEQDYAIASSIQALRETYDQNADGAITAEEGATEFSAAVLDIYNAVETLRNSNTPVTIENIAAALYKAEQQGDSTTKAMDALLRSIDAIPEKKTITITTIYKTEGTPSSESTTITTETSSGGGGEVHEAMQSGGDIIVPSGYEDDKFKIGVSSGERVEVTPKSEVGKEKGNVFININANIASNIDVEVMAQRVAQIIQRRRR